VSTYSPTNTSTYAPTNTSTYAPTYAPTSYTSSVYSPTSNTSSNYSPTSVYAPQDSHNYVGGTTVSSYTGPVTVTVSNVEQATPQNTVQYVSPPAPYYPPVQPPYYPPAPPYYPPYTQQPSCTITANSGYNFNYGNSATVLSWTSSNANSGYISPLVGTVAPSGSTTVYPNGSTVMIAPMGGAERKNPNPKKPGL